MHLLLVKNTASRWIRTLVLNYLTPWLPYAAGLNGLKVWSFWTAFLLLDQILQVISGTSAATYKLIQPDRGEMERQARCTLDRPLLVLVSLCIS